MKLHRTAPGEQRRARRRAAWGRRIEIGEADAVLREAVEVRWQMKSLLEPSGFQSSSDTDIDAHSCASPMITRKFDCEARQGDVAEDENEQVYFHARIPPQPVKEASRPAGKIVSVWSRGMAGWFRGVEHACLPAAMVPSSHARSDAVVQPFVLPCSVSASSASSSHRARRRSV